MRLTQRTRKLLFEAGFILGVGSFLALLGPYQTHLLGWPGVWFYWTGLIGWGALCGWLGGRAMSRFAPCWPDALTYPLISLAISVPVTAAVLALQAVLGDPYPFAAWPVIFFFVWVISAAITFLTWLMERAKTPAGAAEPQIGRALTDKLPVRLRRAELIALQSEDHYLRVHTSAGDTLILMRLSDAIAAASTIEGEQTHRSWWVARAAVTDARREGAQAVLVLTGGLKAPVSRANVPKLREKGWL